MNLSFDEFSYALEKYKSLNKRINSRLLIHNLPYQNVLSLDQYGRMSLFGIVVDENTTDSKIDLIINITEKGADKAKLVAECLEIQTKMKNASEAKKQTKRINNAVPKDKEEEKRIYERVRLLVEEKGKLNADTLEENYQNGTEYILRLPSFRFQNKLRALTVSFSSEDGGAFCGDIRLAYEKSSEELFDALNSFKSFSYRRNNYDLIFLHCDIEMDEIAHIAAPILTFESTLNKHRYDQQEYQFIFLINTIENLPSNIQYVLIDGNRNKATFEKILFSKFSLVASTKMQDKRSKQLYELTIYKHNDKELFLIHYEHFLFVENSADLDYVQKIVDYIKKHVPSFKVDISSSQIFKYKQLFSQNYN